MNFKTQTVRNFKKQIKSTKKIIEQLKSQGMPTKELEDTLSSLEIDYQKIQNLIEDSDKSLIEKAHHAANSSLGSIVSTLISQRIKSNLSVLNIQELTGISRITIHDLEKGERDPHFKKLAVLAYFLGYEIVLKKIDGKKHE